MPKITKPTGVGTILYYHYTTEEEPNEQFFRKIGRILFFHQLWGQGLRLIGTYRSVIDIEDIQAFQVYIHSFQKIVIVFAVVLRPGHFGQCGKPGKGHIFGLLGIGNIFRPELSLSTEDVPGLLGRKFFGDWIVIIDVRQGEVTSDSEWFVWIPRLIIIEIRVGCGRHDDIVPGLSGGDAAFLAPPGHDRGIGRQAALEDLIPPDQSAVFGGQKGVHPLDEITLKFVLIL
jgi:hypothetical protein